MKFRVGKLYSATKRLSGATIVLAITILPVVGVFNSFHADLGKADARKIENVQSLYERPQDKQPLKPFDKPIITVTFDDGWESVYTDALPILQRDGIPTTQFIIAGNFDDPGYLSYDQVKSLHAAGHEIGSHTMSHPDLTKISDSQLVQELANSQATLNTIQPNVVDFAIPYGSVNDHSLAYVKRYYRSARGSDGEKTFDPALSINTKANFDRYNIGAFSVTRDTSLATLKSYIDYTIAHNGWLVLAYHQINDDTKDNYGVSEEDFKQQMDMISKMNIRIAPEGAVLDAVMDKKG